MITYVANYEPVNRPYICKVFKASSGEEFHVALNYSNDVERKEMSVELIYQHLENCVTYIEDKSKEIKIIAFDEPVNNEPWPAKGWIELAWANEEINLWWSYIYYKEERESDPINLNINATEENHTHDPETGEEIPNA